MPHHARDHLTTALGWVSVGLGVPLLTRPAAVVHFLGLDRDAGNRSAAGVHGVGRRRVAGAIGGVATIAAVDVYAAISRSRRHVIEATGAVTVGKSRDEVYAFWRRLETLPRFMAHVEQVRVDGEGRRHWTVRAPRGRTVEWDARITAEQRGSSIEWRTEDGADVEHEGSARFADAPDGRGTEIEVRLRYRLPSGRLGAAVARVLGEEPHQQLDDDLRRLQQVLEAGAVMRSDGAPDGKRARQEFPQRPAQPMAATGLPEAARR